MTHRLTIGIIDYGMGNSRSVANALTALGVKTLIGSDRSLLKAADALILPGVGAFDAAMWNLARQKLDDPIRAWIQADRPFLGICLGMQLLAKTSEEGSACSGLGVIDAQVVAFRPQPGFRVPHVGWNSIELCRKPAEDILFSGVPNAGDFYFDHSYHMLCPPSLVCAHFDYGARHIAALASGSLFATQFHPEKSQRHGLRLLRNFAVHAQQSLLPAAWRNKPLTEAAFA